LKREVGGVVGELAIGIGMLLAIFAPVLLLPATWTIYALRETLETARSGTTIMERTVYEIHSQAELARAASLTYMGGPLSIFLGVYGMASCPDIRSPEGSEHFRQFYDLAIVVLGGGGR
jgi:hypothetical protein